jgi:ribosomal protein L2
MGKIPVGIEVHNIEIHTGQGPSLPAAGYLP